MNPIEWSDCADEPFWIARMNPFVRMSHPPPPGSSAESLMKCYAVLLTLNPELLGDRLMLKVKRLDVIVKNTRGILQDVDVACTVLATAWPVPDVVLSSCLSLPTEDCPVCF